jgi:hypothetical protein
MPTAASQPTYASSPSCRHRNLRSRCGGEQELFQRRACRFFQSTPLIDGDEDSHLHSSPRDDLRPFGDAGLQQFTEARFGVLQRPCSRFFSCAPLRRPSHLVIELDSGMIPGAGKRPDKQPGCTQRRCGGWMRRVRQGSRCCGGRSRGRKIAVSSCCWCTHGDETNDADHRRAIGCDRSAAACP